MPSIEIPPPPAARPYTMEFTGHQKIGFEVNFVDKLLKGWTEITVIPTDPLLKQIKLNCRQCTLKKVSVNGKAPASKYTDPYSKLKLHASSSVNQHHMMRAKLEPMIKDPPEEELIIPIPKSVKIEPSDPFAAAAQNALLNRYAPGSRRDSPDVQGAMTPALTVRADPSQPAFTPILVRVEFMVENIRDGFHFVGCDPDDQRFPHCYTTHSAVPGSACAVLPCIDDVHERCTWEMEITVPRTLGDIRRAARGDVDANGNELYPEDMDEYSDLDMQVVCSGDLVDEVINSADSTKKTLSFCQNSTIPAHHVSFAVGPFEKVNLSDYREAEEDDAMSAIAVDVTGYCLPGRENELRNTCMFMHKAVDFFVKDFGSYPYSSYRLVFVDDLPTPTVEAASMSLCSNHLLFPEDVIDPIYVSTRKLTFTLAAQWVGVSITPKEWADLWVVIGIGYYMTGLFLKKLVGNNEYRFRLKKDAERICEMDVGRPSLYAQGLRVPIDPDDLEFIKLKAPVVLFILERRLTKATGSLVLHRALRRIILHSTSGELPNNELCTQHFIKMCEKLSHSKLDTFFAQWVFGSGYPRFEISQRFNKKKLVIEMGIKQVQATETSLRRLDPNEFMKDARAHQRGVVVGPVVSVYSGPMTIRIHEADGTPYEHVVNITEGYTKLDIPYNTKYKRLKRTRRQKERAAAAAGIDISLDQADDVLLYCLGDVLQSEEEINDWRIEEWSKEEEERMGQESFEWIRMDADFEWICTIALNQPDYMFLSQLQQDRDVVAQYEAIQHFSKARESALISSILVRTLMDRRYYYGIRIEAAYALAKCARAELDWIGEFHLRKAFQEFYCFPGSQLPKGNDFTDFTAYFVQKSIPEAMAMIKNNFGSTPLTVQKFLLDLLRYNDNSNNSATDCHYIATLMQSLAQTLITYSDNDNEGYMNYDFEDKEMEDMKNAALREIERHQRMDQWVPSYQNVISEVALKIKCDLVQRKVIPPNYQELLSYTREGNFDQLRLTAFDCLIDLNALEKPELTAYILHVIAHDPSPYIRRGLLRRFLRGLGSLAIHGKKSAAHQQHQHSRAREGEMLVIEDESSNTTANARKAGIARETISGAIDALKKELGGGGGGDNDHYSGAFAKSIWEAVNSDDLGVMELPTLLEVCGMLYDEKTSLLVVLKFPKHLSCKHLGKGVLQFKWAPRRIVLRERSSLPSAPPPPPSSTGTMSSPPSAPLPTPSIDRPPAPERQPSLTLKLKPPAAALLQHHLHQQSSLPASQQTEHSITVSHPSSWSNNVKHEKSTPHTTTTTTTPSSSSKPSKAPTTTTPHPKKSKGGIKLSTANASATPATPAPTPTAKGKAAKQMATQTPTQMAAAGGTSQQQQTHKPMIVPLKIKLRIPGRTAGAGGGGGGGGAGTGGS